MEAGSGSGGSRAVRASGGSTQTGGASPGGGRPPIHTAIVWFRRDLRLEDNLALVSALQNARNVIPVFVWSPEEEGQFQPGRCGRWWLKRSLTQLNAQLGGLGTRIVHRRSESACTALSDLVEETQAEALFFNHLYDPVSLVRDHEIKQHFIAKGLLCCSFNADLLHEPWEVLDENGQPFTSFKSFWTKVRSMPLPPSTPLSAPSAMPSFQWPVDEDTLESLQISSPEEEASNEHLKFQWTPGSEAAVTQATNFISGALMRFNEDRTRSDCESTSKLSPHLHFGEISVRNIYWMIVALSTLPESTEPQLMHQSGVSDRIAPRIYRPPPAACDAFLRQIGYRDYSRYLSYHFPFTHERAMLEHLRACPWRCDQSLFKAWRQGMTGYPIVDAGMRELWATGWIHNRVRVVVASFLCKNLLLPWQWGLKHFWDALLDADLECDTLGWQYVSGCLADAKPFSHMLDLDAESARIDPDGNYVRRWLPCLARMPTEHIHKPWHAPPSILMAAGIELGKSYPKPVVSEEAARSGVDYAVSVIDACLRKLESSGVSGGGTTHTEQQQDHQDSRQSVAAPFPFRPATMPCTHTAGLQHALPSVSLSMSFNQPRAHEVSSSVSKVVSNTASGATEGQASTEQPDGTPQSACDSDDQSVPACMGVECKSELGESMYDHCRSQSDRMGSRALASPPAAGKRRLSASRLRLACQGLSHASAVPASEMGAHAHANAHGGGSGAGAQPEPGRAYSRAHSHTPGALSAARGAMRSQPQSQPEERSAANIRHASRAMGHTARSFENDDAAQDRDRYAEQDEHVADLDPTDYGCCPQAGVQGHDGGDAPSCERADGVARACGHAISEHPAPVADMPPSKRMRGTCEYVLVAYGMHDAGCEDVNDDTAGDVPCTPQE